MSRIVSEAELISFIDSMARVWWGAVRAEHWSAERARLEVLRADYAAALNPSGIRIWNVACTTQVNGDAGMAAAIILANVIEDEFGIEIDLDVLPELDSFARIQEYLQRGASV